MKQLRVGIMGASGYSGEELLRLLSRHPSAEICWVTSRTYAGAPIGDVFPRFADLSLQFVEPDVEALAGQIDLAFLALPHGLAADYAAPLLAAGVWVVDISADFRLRDPAAYALYYGGAHPAPALLAEAVYGLPERYREQLGGARLVACPGCYPTSIILPVAPILEAGIGAGVGIMVASMSGVSGAGRKVDLPFIFPECNESVRPYAVTGHRHLPEIEQELTVANGAQAVRVNFIPHLVPINRGIHSTIIMEAEPGVDAGDVHEVLTRAYADEPFVRVLPLGKLADTKHVSMTNVCEIGGAFDARTKRIILSSAIDNLTKGASGQAVQCMNVVTGLPETTGLVL